MQDDHPYVLAVRTWQSFYKGAPEKRPLKSAFGVSEHDFADTCTNCANSEAVFEYSYDDHVTRFIPSGFPDHLQMPHDRLCALCLEKRHPQEAARLPVVVQLSLRLPRYLLEAIDRRVATTPEVSREGWIRDQLRAAVAQ